MRRSTIPGFYLFLILCCTSGKYFSGNINNGQSWVFVSEFAFIDNQGKLEYKVEYSVTGECCPPALHPGVVTSDIGRNWKTLKKPYIRPFVMLVMFLFFKDCKQGAQTTIYCSVAEELEGVSGLYYSDCKVKEGNKLAKDPGLAKKLWDARDPLIGQSIATKLVAYTAVTVCLVALIKWHFGGGVCKSKARLDATNYSTQCLQSIYRNLRKCSGVLHVYSTDQWWFFVLSHCNSSQGLDVSYEFTFTNGDSWEKHLSGEETHGVEALAVSFGATLVLFLIGLLFARKLLQLENKLQKAFKVFMASLSCEVIVQLFTCIYYIPYIRSGIQIPYLKNVAEFLHLTSEVLFILLLVWLAHGWTMTKVRISKDLYMFCSLLAFTYGGLFAYKQASVDLLFFHFVLESLADKGLQFLRIIAWVCFVFGIYLSIRNHSDKKKFYSHFGAYYSVWFLLEPLSTIVFSFFLSGPSSVKIMRLFRISWLNLLGFGGILRLMMPSMVDVVFPYRAPVNEVATVQV
ncbi:transmembrane protein 145-like [Stylophora pistillata]|uniref:transmembrane protein 145-like n=1 Tax=Stylophora pistillata TaxID=50429 RepID=UPI000C03DB92|nr:transmembrane protein 145-like [Stylophora pistillata]